MFDLNIPKDGVGDTPQSTPAKTHKQLSDNLLAMLDKMQQQVQYNARLLTQVVVVHALNKKRYRVPVPGASEHAGQSQALVLKLKEDQLEDVLVELADGTQVSVTELTTGCLFGVMINLAEEVAREMALDGDKPISGPFVPGPSQGT